MALHFHPKIVQVVNLGDDYLAGAAVEEEFFSSLTELQKVHAQQVERFQFFSEGQKQTEESRQFHDEVKDAFDVRRQTLEILLEEELSEEELEAGLLQIIQASQRLSKLSDELEESDTSVRFAKFPLLHDFVQAGLNVYSDHRPQDILEERLPLLISWIQDVEQDWQDELELFSILEPKGEDFGQILTGLQEGVGGIFLYLEEGDGQNLLAGLHLLQETSDRLARFMAECQEAVLDQSEHSPFRDIERLAVRAAKLDAEDPKLTEATEAVERLLEGQQAQLAEFSEMPVDTEEFHTILEDLEAALGEELSALEEMRLEALCEASQDYWNLQEELADCLESAAEDIEEAPALQELRKVLLGVYLGQTPNRFLSSMIEVLFEPLERAYEAEEDPDTRQALEFCLAALEQAGLFLQTRDGSHLVEARRLLEVGATASIAVEQENQRQMAIEKERMKVACIKCGHRNEPTLSNCEECHAKLPFVADEKLEAASGSMVDSGGEQLPQNVQQLLDLSARMEEGRAGVEEVRATVEPLLRRAKKLGKQMTRNSSDERSTQFCEGVETYIRGLSQLLEQAENGSASMVTSAMAVIREGAEKLEPFLQESAAARS